MKKVGSFPKRGAIVVYGGPDGRSGARSEPGQDNKPEEKATLESGSQQVNLGSLMSLLGTIAEDQEDSVGVMSELCRSYVGVRAKMLGEEPSIAAIINPKFFYKY
ncbi:hypothetical protein PROH_21175 [Prochlorothrix hollandica PCC 9006 = CALU 1027]|uniref:Uncharacterized protein n=1 Tax=Prochlorothrix hollandica PCC 9006 = CALU 1027 TaxID=317619 RepID=A0A0M2PUX2_PROHO|nr:hypothetical protein PROH_21175 [Prochlorothrix hollandica PCC 9006 = CALU 1027]